MTRLPIAPFALALLAGCATMSGRTQYVSIDSTQRGLDVVDAASGEKLGKTPLFVPITRRSSLSFELVPPAGAPLPVELSCRYRWGGALLGNLPFAGVAALVDPIVGAGVYVGANVLDLVTGGAFDCPLTTLVDAGSVPRASDACDVYAVPVPKHPDDKLARLAIERWRERLEQASPCSRVASQADVDGVLVRYGITNDTGLDLAHVDRSQLNELGYVAHANRLAILQLDEQGAGLDVRGATYDLHAPELTPLPVEAFRIDTATDPGVGRGLLANVGRYLSIVPNALAYALSYKVLNLYTKEAPLPPGGLPPGAEPPPGFEPPPGAETDPLGFPAEQTAPTESLASYLANFTLTTIDHPDRHGPWALAMELAPVIVAGYTERQVLLRAGVRTAGALHLLALYDVNGYLHTPIGAFSLSLGLGGGYARSWDNGALTASGGHLYSDVNLGYTFFPTRRLYVRLYADSITELLQEPDVVGDGYTGYGLSTAGVTVGWYMPELRDLAREVL